MLRCLVLFLCSVVGLAPAALAQYMYLDTNGDGVHTAADVLQANGTPTTVDVWLHTNANRDGSPAVCNSGPEPLTINSYVVNLEAVGGTVTYSAFINRQPQFGIHFTDELNPDGVRYKNGYGGFPPPLDPGLYRLATLTITGQAGTPAVRIVDLVSGSVEHTSFGTMCVGREFDNTYKLAGPAGGTDWTDADGTEGGPGLTNAAPVLAPIGAKTGTPGVPLTFTATATDPDLPPQALTFSLGPYTNVPATIDPSSGVFAWIPSSAGEFFATVIVADNGTPRLSDFEIVDLLVTNTTEPPMLSPIPDKTTNEGGLLTFVATVTDPTQSGLTWTLEPGAPAGAFIGAENGLFQWVIAEGEGPGVHPITVTVTSSANGSSDSETFVVTVNEVNAFPQFTGGVGDMTVTEGETATQQLTAFDADIPAQTLFFSKTFGPPFALVSATGLITLSPGSTDSGTYTLRVRVSDGNLFASSSLDITVLDIPPVADAGGPYEGIVGVPVHFDGTGSSDSDGNPLTYAWNFGDGQQGVGATPAHTYQGAAVYEVTLTITAGGETASDATTATILPDLEMVVFTTGGNKAVRLGSGKQQMCVQMEAVAGSFEVVDVQPASIRMTYGGFSIPALSGKTVLGSDKNQNGLDEITACFSKEDLRNLFADLPNGEQTVHVLLEATHVSGVPIQGSLSLRVFQTGGGPSLSVAPNPLNPSAMVTFVTSRPGSVRVLLFDLHGRLVRTLRDVPSAPAGHQDLTLDGFDAAGRRLASGIYYIVVRTVDGSDRRAITILK